MTYQCCELISGQQRPSFASGLVFKSGAQHGACALLLTSHGALASSWPLKVTWSDRSNGSVGIQPLRFLFQPKYLRARAKRIRLCISLSWLNNGIRGSKLQLEQVAGGGYAFGCTKRHKFNCKTKKSSASIHVVKSHLLGNLQKVAKSANLLRMIISLIYMPASQKLQYMKRSRLPPRFSEKKKKKKTFSLGKWHAGENVVWTLAFASWCSHFSWCPTSGHSEAALHSSCSWEQWSHYCHKPCYRDTYPSALSVSAVLLSPSEMKSGRALTKIVNNLRLDGKQNGYFGILWNTLELCITHHNAALSKTPWFFARSIRPVGIFRTVS